MSERRRERHRKRKAEKVSFLEGMQNRVRETLGLGRVLVTEPRAFPGALGKVAKRSVRTLWDARGGGLYACGFVLTLIWLELTTLFGEIVSSGGIVEFFSEQVLEFLFRFTIDSFQNTIYAFLWPVYVIRISPIWGGAMLALLYVVFSRFIKDPLEDWLFHDDETPTDEIIDDSVQKQP